MGGAMKGGYGHMHGSQYGNGGGSNSNGSWGGGRKRWNNVYLVTVIMLLLFGVGVLGVMGLHRLRDRRIFSLLLKDKDDQIHSLQLLLQKEREQTREVKSKAEELRMKVYNLRAQKVELKGKILELESTISSLKDEQKTIELAFQEKQNEAKSLREANDQNPQVKALTEVLQQKEAEIQDLKHQLQFPAKIWSVSSDDPSIQTAKANTSSNETVINHMHESGSQDERKKSTDDVESNNSLKYRETESSMQRDEGRENGSLGEGIGGITRKNQFEETRNSQENEKTRFDRNRQTELKENYDHQQNDESFGTGKNRREETHFTDVAAEGNGQSGGVSNSNGNYYQGLGVRKGGVKMETQENLDKGSHRLRWKSQNLKRTKGKRWITTGKEIEGNLNSRSNEAAENTRNHQLVKGKSENDNITEEGKPINRAKFQDLDAVKPNGHIKENNGENNEESPPGIKSRNSLNSVDTQDTSQNVAKVEHIEASQQVDKGWEGILTNSSSDKSHITDDGEPKYTRVKSYTKGKVQYQEVDKQPKRQGFDIRELTNNKNDDKSDDSPRQTTVVEKIDISDDVEQAYEETEPGDSISTDNVSSEKNDGVNDEEKAQTNEPEF